MSGHLLKDRQLKKALLSQRNTITKLHQPLHFQTSIAGGMHMQLQMKVSLPF